MDQGNNQPGDKQSWMQRDVGELLRWKRLPGWSRAAAFVLVGVVVGVSVAGSPAPVEAEPVAAEVVTETATEVVTETVTETVTEEADPEPKPEPEPKPKPYTVPKEGSGFDDTDYADLTNRQFAKIMRNPAAHVGEKVLIFGEIFQFDQFTTEDAFLADVTGNQDPCTYNICDYWSKGSTALLVSNGADFSNLIEEDVFMAHGTVVGEYQYDTQIGGSTGAVEFTVEKIVPHKK